MLAGEVTTIRNFTLGTRLAETIGGWQHILL